MNERKISALEKRNKHNEISPTPTRRKFESVTRIFLASEKSRDIFCPYCGNPLNFGSEVEWMGPDAFLCTSCDKLLHISLIQRALRDLGVIK
jgi:hypothetical protein